MNKYLIIFEDCYGYPCTTFVYGNSEHEIEILANKLFGKRLSYVEEIKDYYFYTIQELEKEMSDESFANQ